MGVLEKVPGTQNWIDRLPGALKARWNSSIIYRAAVHMHRKGMSPGHAIASARTASTPLGVSASA